MPKQPKAKDETETNEAPAAVDESATDVEAEVPTEQPESDQGDVGVLCGRCGKTFTEDEAVEGVSCTHNKCPMNV